MSATEFLSIIKESQFNIIEIFKKAPNESLIVLAILILIFLILYFFINRSIKANNTVKLVDKIQDAQTYDEYNEKMLQLINELPRRGEKVAEALNVSKNHILLRSSKFLINVDIASKIEKYKEISEQYKKIASASKKYNIQELSEFYEAKAIEMIDENLAHEIVYYYENIHFNENEVKNVNAIVAYANSLLNPNSILVPLIDTMNKFSYGYNTDLYKFIEKLDKENSRQIYENAKIKMEELFTSGENEVSINILEYLLENNEKQKVYEYISTLKLENYLQQLYDLLFNKKGDINLDLAFISNPTKINHQYKAYLDESLTDNWRDPKHIEFISNSKGVLEVLGHMEYRTLIERIDNIELEKENRKMVEEALVIAKRAESLALEAKSLNKKPIIVPTSLNKKDN